MSGPVEPTPDAKDWTWVVDRPCPECGFVAAGVEVADVGALVAGSARRWRQVLGAPGCADRRRPDVWSPLEYACHVRDVFVLFDERLSLMLTEDDPLFANWDQDATAVAERYRDQDPATVAPALGAAAERVAASFDAVVPDQLGRTGRRSDGASFTVTSFARYFVHDPIHHVWDVTGTSGTDQVAADRRAAP